MPVLVATASGPAALETLATTPREARAVDWVEVRLDQIARDAWPRTLSACDALMASDTPVLATIRWSREGGAYPNDDEERVALYRDLLPRVHAIDVELASAHAATLVRAAHEAGRTAVLSAHDFDKTPELASLEAAIAQGLALDADIVKIAAVIFVVSPAMPTYTGIVCGFESRHRFPFVRSLGLPHPLDELHHKEQAHERNREKQAERKQISKEEAKTRPRTLGYILQEAE